MDVIRYVFKRLVETIPPTLGMFLLTFVLFDAAAEAAPKQGMAPARTAAAVDALSSGARREARPFVLEGEIAAKLSGPSAIFADATGRLHVRASSNDIFRAGQRVRIVGTAALDQSNQLQCEVSACTVLGTFEPPPPRAVAVRSILEGRENCERVTVTGVVADVFRDEVDANWSYFVLKSEGHSLLVSIPGGVRGREAAAKRLQCVCRITGVVLPDHGNMRRYIGPHLELADIESVVTVEAAAGSPFDAPPLEDFRRRRPEDILRTGLRTLKGRVAAVWSGGRRMIVVDDRGEPHNVELMDGIPPPLCDSRVEIAGYPTTDLYLVNFTRAQVRTLSGVEPNADPSTFVDQASLFRDRLNRPMAPMAYHGWPVRLRGVVSGRDERGRVLIREGGFQIPYDIDRVPELAGVLADGTTVEVVGTGVAETDSWRPGAEFTTVRSFFVSARRPADVRILARAPWWTFGRFMTVIGILLGLLAGVVAWNRMLNRLVRRRSQELFRKDVDRVAAELRTEDRMRLAVELHDSVSQSLTGVALQVDSALLSGAGDVERSRLHMQKARRILENCREELRNCLWDLRNRALDEADSAVAIRKTVAPHAGEARLDIDFTIPRAAFSDTTFHDVLRILRELVVNAVRHGKAAHVTVSGVRESDRLAFSVCDDGCGFDPTRRLGVGDGHFGLVGIEERLRLLGGRLEIDSAPGRGTTVRFSIERTKRE